MDKKRLTTKSRRRVLLERLEAALADSVETRRSVNNRLERDAANGSLPPTAPPESVHPS
jgi:hypothetical protein